MAQFRRVLDFELKGPWFETCHRHIVVSLSKTFYPLLGTSSIYEDRKPSHHELMTQKLLTGTERINKNKNSINLLSDSFQKSNPVILKSNIHMPY